jgi:hypothetical protein
MSVHDLAGENEIAGINVVRDSRIAGSYVLRRDQQALRGTPPPFLDRQNGRLRAGAQLAGAAPDREAKQRKTFSEGRGA